MATNRDGYIVWLDLEMTGLDPDRERIIEIATVITDAQLNIVKEGPDLVVHQPDAILDGMDEWNRTHHGGSGLTERVRRSRVSESEAEDQTLSFVSRYIGGARKAPLAGNSIHQDRRFLERYMPRLNDYLHYRNIDVSTVKELAKRWYPDVRPYAKENSHRALEDIRESIAELRYYRQEILR
ncbi:MAG: oligoribonuclease [Myxococcales bacterium]|nr:oligoribonuclease [Myxococcales bacterium]MCB9519712.1 oligoribonuclease [Myxococcales bacterium]MCB9530403.1 oligoribonuclease [Myxococcales bacterium]MCB9533650.1 oligoribonuclease [Myxococcales bacterium]